MLRAQITTLIAVSMVLATGCQSPQYADRMAAGGALGGAGIGAIVGNQTGNSAEGALVGAALGAITGSVVGDQMDQLAAQNRAAIANQMGRQVAPGAATIPEVISMHQAGVDPQLIRSYIDTSGIAAPLSANDVIALHQQGIPTEIIQTMQNVSNRPPVQAASAQVPQQTVIVHDPFYPPPIYCGPPGWHRVHRCGPPPGRVAWGISVGL